MFKNYKRDIREACLKEGHSPETADILLRSLSDDSLLSAIKYRSTPLQVALTAIGALRTRVGQVRCSWCGNLVLKTDCREFGRSRERMYMVCTICKPWEGVT